ncbi:MAG TPA: FecR domain-containing protein [Pedobacter sp.]|nr:FecR domain-containing protein [Pedobacter sp.]
MKNPAQLHLFFQKYLDNNCTIEEAQQLMNHFHIAEDEELLRKMVADALAQEEVKVSITPKIEEIVHKVDENLFEQIFDKKKVISIERKRFRYWKEVVSAAAIVIVMLSGIYVYRFSVHETSEVATIPQDIKPGGEGATLTLADGRRIKLTDAKEGQIVNEAGIIVVKAANGELVYKISGTKTSNEINTLSTNNGETYTVVLPDKSKVWLNAASSLSYTTGLIVDGKRHVKLEGEAYFEISKDSQHPFIVECEKQQIKVLGTHFNISSYRGDDEVKTTLLEGSIKLTSNQIERILKPNQQAVLTGDQLKVEEVDATDAVAWKNGYFSFHKNEITEIMEELKRWYDIDVSYQGSPSTVKMGGSIARSETLSEVLKAFESTGQLKYKIEGRRVVIMR